LVVMVMVMVMVVVMVVVMVMVMVVVLAAINTICRDGTGTAAAKRRVTCTSSPCGCGLWQQERVSWRRTISHAASCTQPPPSSRLDAQPAASAETLNVTMYH
jgi:hypothetical protein